ncbi:inter-alpha-trypsin inhibitor heavy chain H3-like isoform X1 [Leucoraja erinacea]|uniref:inter-alpha-trypsin inhibitor heavy chain H3-like isoform X1 n=1 Tax=Leucoraja erinaceus TaxID=7782 RepID=UPI00245532E6|nr:inter-alpha-trypsin inhibitor heavy chain H3-like isoform X1 [Leucoraja erinacea]
MKTMLTYFLLISIPAIISSDIIIEADRQQSDYVNPGSSISKLSQRTVKKRSPTDPRPTPLRELEIYSMKIDSKVTSRFAHNVINSRMVNRANASQEAFFEIELPKTAFITNFSMTLDGVTYVGAVKEKEAAQKQYQQAVSMGQTAGIVQRSGRKMEKFDVSVNIAPTKKVTFELTYEELLKRHLGKYEMSIRVNPKQLVNHFQIDVHIFEQQGISFLDVDAKFPKDQLASIVRKSLNGTKGHVSFKPSLRLQRKCRDCLETVLDGEFNIYYDVHRDLSAGSIQIVNGYFVHHFAPANLTKIPKNVIFVIDHSGSMSGTKMRQTNEALLKILDDMDEKDHFAIIIFDDAHETWRNSLFQASRKNVDDAKTFVRTIMSSGATNINSPMLKAVELLNKAHQEKKLPERSVSMIILLTDGDPNTGVSNPNKIQKNVKKAVNGRYNVYTLGFGFDVKFSFLEKLALENNGLARRIYEDSDASLQLQGFYDEVANPLLLDIELQYPEIAISDLTQARFRQYYDGSEIVVAGRIIDNTLESLATEVVAQAANETLTLKVDVNIAEVENVTQQQYIFGDFTERLWAYLTIQQLLDQRITADEIKAKRLTDRILELSLKYSFVTPLTSMVVTKPNDAKNETLVADKPSENENGREPFPMRNNRQRKRLHSHHGVSMSSHPGSHGHHGFQVAGQPGLFSFRGGSVSRQRARPRNKGILHSVRTTLVQTKAFLVKEATYDSLADDYDDMAATQISLPDYHDIPATQIRLPDYHDIPGSDLMPDSYDLTLVDSDPHFITSVNSHKDTVCFNIDGKPGLILNLITDPFTGFVVNGQLIGEKKVEKNKKINTYFGKFGIVNSNMDVKVEVSTDATTMSHGEDKTVFPWSVTTSVTMESFSFSIVKETNLTLVMGGEAIFVIVLHRVWKYHPLHRDFLGFYTLDSHRLSNMTHGLIGQFYHELNADISNIRPGLDEGKPDATMVVKGHTLRVTRGYQKDYRFDPIRGNNISCWFVHNNGEGFIDGTLTDYTVPSLFAPLRPIPK